MRGDGLHAAGVFPAPVSETFRVRIRLDPGGRVGVSFIRQDLRESTKLNLLAPAGQTRLGKEA